MTPESQETDPERAAQEAARVMAEGAPPRRRGRTSTPAPEPAHTPAEQATQTAAAEPATAPSAEEPETPADEQEQVREQIEETREELGETVEALAQKADLKGQAQLRLEERKQALRAKREELKGRVPTSPDQARQAAGEALARAKERPAPLAIGAGLLGALLLLSLLRRRK